jgi:hypothetical protein
MADDKNIKFSKEEIENVKEFNKAFRNVNDEVNSLFEGLNSVSDEIKGQIQGYQLANKAVNNLTSIFGKLKDIQENIKTANSKDLKSLQEKALSEKKNLIESQRLLQVKATTFGLTEKEVATLANVNGLLETQEGLYQNIEDTLNQIVQNEQIVEDTLGNLGTLTEGFSEGLKKAGLGALDTKLGLGDALQKTKDMVAAGEGNVSKMGAVSHLAKQLGSNLMKSLGPLALIAIAVEQIVDAFKMIDSTSGNMAKDLGISYKEAQGLSAEMNQVAINSNDIIVSTKSLMQAQSSLNNMFETSVQFSGEMAEQFNSVQKRLKLSDEAMSSFTKLGLQNGKNLYDNLGIVNKTLLVQNQQNKTSFSQKQIQESIGKTSAATRLTLRGSTEELTKAAANAKKLGLEIEDLGKISNSLLDFESSISAEMEAELLTGKELNLERARLAALNGDSAVLAAEISSQIGNSVDFGKKNVIQQEALAKAFGLSRNELADMLVAQESQQKLQALGFENLNDAQEKYNKLIDSGLSKEKAMAAIGDDQLANQLASISQQEKLAAITDRLKELFVGLMEPLMPVLDIFMDIFEKAVKPIMKVLTPIVKILGDLLQGMLIPALNMIMEPIQEIGNLMQSMLPAGVSLGDTFKTIGKIIGPLILIPFRSIFFMIDMIKENLKGFKEVFSGIGDMLEGNILQGLKKIGVGIMRVVLSPIQALVDLAIGLVNNIIEGLNDIPGVDITPIGKNNIMDSVGSMDSIPFATGGIVTGPTRALIGEAGTEAVIPLDKFYDKLDELINTIKQGGNVYLDGTKVGTAMAVSTYRVQ